ncbi:MAG: histidine phosphatase family protein [Bryobacteraceae bacterium]|nr:histidine phosphatase family protein [Bryobacteraceae bacterium]
MLPLLLLLSQTIFVVRHAERTGDPDPPLNEQGRARAEALAHTLRDARVKHFFASDTLRAQGTAEPAAKAAGRRVEIYKQTALDELVARVRTAVSKGEAALIVGHRETVPRIVKAIGGREIAPLKSGEHDRLIVVAPGPAVVELRYGAKSDE